MRDERKSTDAASDHWSSAEWREDLVSAAAFLTRLPVAQDLSHSFDLSRASRAFPVAGAVIGALGALVLIIGASIGLSPFLAAAFAIFALIVLTGALHEDGLADTADGFWGGADREGKLAIMRDSRIGTFGVLTLLFSVIVRIAALDQILETGTIYAAAALVAAGTLSRHGMVALMARMPAARSDGMAFSAGSPAASASKASLIIALAIAIPTAWLAGGIIGVFVTGVLAVAVFMGVRELANRHIGGYTGDVCGALQQAVEITVLVALALTAGA
jgi:adenosylcobinamide-GDP ribazoletransferase